MRFVAALVLHTKDMTVEQAQELFEDEASVDPGNVRQQAVRGTFDPLYLAYTLGKLMVREFAAEVDAAAPGAARGELRLGVPSDASTSR